MSYQDIEKAIKDLKQNNLFSGDEEVLEEACVSYLRSKGYGVKKIFNTYGLNIKSKKNLVEYFYSKYTSKNPGDHPYRNDGRDLKVAERFVGNISKTLGLNDKYALLKCADVIDVVIDNLEDFNFIYSLNFGIFGQEKFSWVTNKALEIIKKREQEKDDEYVTQKQKLIEENYNEEELGISNLDELYSELED